MDWIKSQEISFTLIWSPTIIWTRKLANTTHMLPAGCIAGNQLGASSQLENWRAPYNY
jgi:hypothetical protein